MPSRSICAALVLLGLSVSSAHAGAIAFGPAGFSGFGSGSASAISGATLLASTPAYTTGSTVTSSMQMDTSIAATEPLTSLTFTFNNLTGGSVALTAVLSGLGTYNGVVTSGASSYTFALGGVTTSSDLTLTLDVDANTTFDGFLAEGDVPEPATFLLAAAGVGLLLGARRKLRKA